MKKILLLFLCAFCNQISNAQAFSKKEILQWQQQAKTISIIRDNWGIPHVYGKTDADAVFGLLYAQCEDDFKRVELNYIEKLGRKAEVFGESELYNDLYIRLIIDSADAVADYKKAPSWLKKLLNAYSDGINFYLYKHPEIKPLLLHHFKPWYPLLWTDGSIGAISTGNITEKELKDFYMDEKNMSLSPINKLFEVNSSLPALATNEDDQKNVDGSNGFAIAPMNTVDGNSILYINPHTTFYFRPEVQMSSEEGLSAYGAVTWGQFFIYQGFNQHCGWMHTSSNVDVSDMYNEKIRQKGKGYEYQYDNKWLPVKEKKITLQYKEIDIIKTKIVSTYFTHHGPIMAKRNNQLISVKSSNRTMNGLIQSWQRTKAKGLEDYKKVMNLKANNSNNTVFADNKGNIAFWHGNFVPKRDTNYNWSNPVDGSTPKTEWKGLHEVAEIVHIYNPQNGWIQNCNSTPYTVSGDMSPKKINYRKYMAPDGENFRGVNAVRLLSKEKQFTMDKIIATGYNTYLSSFEILIPPLINAFEKTAQPTDSLYTQLADAISILKKWDYHVNENSIATTLAIEWAQLLNPNIRKVYIDEGELDQVQQTKLFATTATPEELLIHLHTVLQNLKNKMGTWQVTWGTINRYQRVSNDLKQQYNDAEPSVPVPFASALWGMLPAYNSAYFNGTIKRYGVSGNSFVCAVEFGKTIKAKSLLAGGVSGNPKSKHFNDQLLMYTKGQFKDVLFYKEDVIKHAEKKYHPGE
jgi:acyl-homoserine-lactone acylase